MGQKFFCAGLPSNMKASCTMLEIGIQCVLEVALKWMLQRSMLSILEVSGNGCYYLQHAEQVGSSLNCMLQGGIQSVLEDALHGCYNIASKASWKLLKIVVATEHA